MTRTATILSLALLASLALTCCLAKDASSSLSPSSTSLASKLLPSKPRTARSLTDMLEKMKSKIFGNKKQSTSSQVQPAASVNAAQRQPWNDLNSFNQQYNPYSSLSSGQYQWPSAQSGNQYLGQQYSPVSGYIGSQSIPSSSYQGLSSAASQQVVSSMLPNMLETQQQPQGSLSSAANPSSAGNGGLLSSASHLIAQYLSPSSPAASQSISQGLSGSGQQSSSQSQIQSSGSNQNILSPQQQQQQSQYNEFASILDSMVAQTGVTQQRIPSGINQYLNTGSIAPGQQAQQAQQGYQPSSGSLIGNQGPLSVGDNDMSGSNNIQSYMPAATQQQASQKSSMVSLAEQLAPGAQFNKLVSFPFSLSNNDDPSKDGRYKLHIPFLNQHVKRSDQQQQVGQARDQQRVQNQQQPQYSSYQQYSNSPVQQQQLIAQSSQAIPTIVSPQSSISQSAPVLGPQSSQSSIAASPSSASISSSSSVQTSSSSSSASSSSIVPQSPSSSLLSSQSASQSNSRPTWSVADLQSNSSGSKLIPLQSAASSSIDSASQN